MRTASTVKAGAWIAGLLTAAVCVCAQQPAVPAKFEGIPPRATPADYQFHAQAGKLTVAAEFTGHSVAMPEGILTTEDYVVIETGIYGPPGAHATLAPGNFSLRVNGKKPLPGLPYGLVVKTLKDPNMEPPASASKSKTSIGSTGQGDNSPPAPVRVPDITRHLWGERLQKASLPEGDRALPQAGLVYFAYHGRTEKIESLELTYTGPEGTATMALEP